MYGLCRGRHAQSTPFLKTRLKRLPYLVFLEFRFFDHVSQRSFASTYQYESHRCNCIPQVLGQDELRQSLQMRRHCMDTSSHLAAIFILYWKMAARFCLQQGLLNWRVAARAVHRGRGCVQYMSICAACRLQTHRYAVMPQRREW